MSTSQNPRPPLHIVQISYNPIRYRCGVCTTSRTMKSYGAHVASAAHSIAAEKFLTRQAANQVINQQFELHRSPTPPAVQDLDHFFEDIHDLSDTPANPPSPLTFLRSFLENNGRGNEAVDTLGNGFDDDTEDEAHYVEELEKEFAAVNVEEAAGWYPFKKKEHVVALLMTSSNRSLLSRTQYHFIWSILRICDVILPEWGTLRELVKKLKHKLGLEIRGGTSPCGNPLFGLDIKTIISNVSTLYAMDFN
ncbi:hypothetical protein DFH28DRAFT_1196635 [Melampsora americana]|nr:hypothetical protein DFH28DRAFT_1196635 [Melampsora americana]